MNISEADVKILVIHWARGLIEEAGEEETEYGYLAFIAEHVLALVQGLQELEDEEAESADQGGGNVVSLANEKRTNGEQTVDKRSPWGI